MYGTVARMKIRPGVTAQEVVDAQRTPDQIPGLVSRAVYQADSDPQEVWMSVVFTDKEAYVKNAQSPDQNANYERTRALLAEDPEWHDGTLIRTHP